MKTLNYLLKAPFCIALAVIVYLNVSLYSTQSYNAAKGYDEDVYAQLQHLKYELHENDAGIKMQGYYPEGFVFLNALYGLTWCELLSENTDTTIRNEAIKEVDWALDELLSKNGTYIFNEDLPVPYGVFYKGWTNLLLAERLKLSPDSVWESLHQQFSKEIASAFDRSTSPFLESYVKACWPCDNIIAAASLKFSSTNTYDSTLATWSSKMKRSLDENGLIPHSVTFPEGKPYQAGRGNSLSLGLNYLHSIDSIFAQAQFTQYKKLFLDSRLGLPGIREHRMGKGGNGDIDSGPVILGIGGAASIVGQKTMATFGEWDTYHGLRNSIESFGAAYTWNGKRKYVFGQVPMADAFIAWSNVSAAESEIKSGYWQWKFQLISVALALLLILLIRKNYFTKSY